MIFFQLYVCFLGYPRTFKLVNQCWPQIFLVKYTQRKWENQKNLKNFDIFNPLKPFKVLVHTAIYPVFSCHFQILHAISKI